MRKLARTAIDVFEAQHNHVRAKRCYGSKISKGEFIKVMIGLTKLMRKGDTVRCLLVSKGAKRFTLWFKGVQGGSKVITHSIPTLRA
jgi:hypothetical protein